MNPYDDGGLGAEATPAQVRVWLERVAGDPRRRQQARAMIAALEADPGICRVWRLTSRTMGRPHPIDATLAAAAALTAPAPELPEAEALTAWSARAVGGAKERAEVLGALVELPELPEEPMIRRGALQWRGVKGGEEG